MRTTPRNVRLALALLLACAAGAAAAPARQKAPREAAGQAKAGARAAKAREAAERLRGRGLALLREVAAAAPAVEDASERASLLTLCADALWEADEPAARSAFRDAWEAAAESDERDLKEAREADAEGGAPESFTGARDAVLAAAARRDARLADDWLAALAEWLSRRGGPAADESERSGGAGPDVGPRDESTREGRRLALASALAAEGEHEAAARVLAPALRGVVSGALVESLIGLRARAPEEADRLYLRLLADVRGRADASANDVLLLSSYALTPRLLAAVNADGSIHFRPLGAAGAQGRAAQAALASEALVRPAFLQTAAAILLRPAEAAAGDAAARYFAAGRLLPFFEREQPRLAQAVRERLAELASAVDAARRSALDSQMQTRALSPQNPADPLARVMETVADAGGGKPRDDARVAAVAAAAKLRLWERARRVAEAVEDPAARRSALTVIDSYRVAYVVETFEGDDDDFERAAAVAREADVHSALRSYGFARAAELAHRRGRARRAAALLEAALDAGADCDAGTPHRSAAWMGAATVAARLGSPRLRYALGGAVASINEDETFDGGRADFDPARRVYLPGEAEALEAAFRTFDLRAMFDAAARRDFDSALAEAGRLRDQAARPRALVAVARAVLLGPARGAAR